MLYTIYYAIALLFGILSFLCGILQNSLGWCKTPLFSETHIHQCFRRFALLAIAFLFVLFWIPRFSICAQNTVSYYLFVQNLAFSFEIVMRKYCSFARIRYSDNLGVCCLKMSLVKDFTVFMGTLRLRIAV